MKRMNRILLIITIIAISVLSGCNSQADESLDSVAESVSESTSVAEESVESIVREENEEIEDTVETTIIEDETVYTFQFPAADDEAVKLVLEKEDYEYENAMTYRTDMDLDGTTEALVLVPTYKNMGTNYEKDGYMAGDLWLVCKDGQAEKICDNTDIALSGYCYTASDRKVVIVNRATAFVNEQGMTVEYVNGEIKVQNDFPGSIVLDEDEMVVWAEDYLSFADVTECSVPREGMWTGHTWIPYYFYYDETVADFVLYDETVVSIETVEDMAELDTSYFEGADAIQYIYVDNGYLEVNAAAKDLSSDYYKDVSFTNYEFRLDYYEGKWEFIEERSGIYKLGYYEDIEWDFLDADVNAAYVDPYKLPGIAPSKEVIDQYGHEDGHSVLSFHIVPQTAQEYEDYYVVDAIYAKPIEVPGNLAIGEQITVVFNELTGDKRTLERREDGLYQLEDVENEPFYPTYFQYWGHEDGSPSVLYDENNDRTDAPVYEGKLYIRKDATIESALDFDIKAATKEALNRETWFNGVYFDENGYVTRLVYYGD